jgi:hypothetical protein
MKHLIHSIFFLLLFSAGLSAQPRKVLLVGNSYTAYNNLNQMLTQLAAGKGDTLEVFAVSPGGYTFQSHSTYPPTLDMIDSLPWDFVVLQEQSQRPAFPQSQVEVEVYPYARALDSLILLNNPCTETVFYMTWGRKYGDTQNCAIWPPVCSFAGMQQLLRDSYVKMADDNDALVAPAGEAWQRSWAADSSINLWVADNSHPSLFGSYLTACVLYSTMMRKPSSGSSWLGGLSPAQAAFLQGVADSTVFDSLSTWNIGDYDVVAGFSASVNGLQVQFNNSSTNSTSYAWTFGDGSVSTLSNPVHAYSAPGSYSVSLISGNACSSDTFLLNVSVATTGLATDPYPQTCRVYSAANVLFWNCNEVTAIEVYSASGQLVQRIAASDSIGSLHLEGLPAGIYQVLAFGSGKVLCSQRVKID